VVETVVVPNTFKRTLKKRERKKKGKNKKKKKKKKRKNNFCFAPAQTANFDDC
jgi:hypothetical protein